MIGSAEVVPMDVDGDKKMPLGRVSRLIRLVLMDLLHWDNLPPPRLRLLTLTRLRLDKPVGRPAVKKIPEPEKEKAPETKARYGRKPRA